MQVHVKSDLHRAPAARETTRRLPALATGRKKRRPFRQWLVGSPLRQEPTKARERTSVHIVFDITRATFLL